MISENALKLEERPATQPVSDLMSLKETADFLRISESTACKNWAGWSRFGVEAFRFGKRLYFKRSQLLRMIELHKVN